LNTIYVRHLLAATLSLVLGFLALSRINRNGDQGRLAAYIGIGYGVLNYVVRAISVVRDLVDPINRARNMHAI